MSSDSPASILFDELGNPIGVLSDGIVYRLQTDSRITDGTNIVGVTDVAPGVIALKVDVVKTVSSGSVGVGGTSSNFADPFPIAGTAVGFSDGYFMRDARVFDLDTDIGTQYTLGVNLRGSAFGGSVEVGTNTNPIRIDPTGVTTQPVSGTVTANAGSGTFTVAGTVVANAGTGNFTVVQGTAANLNATVVGTVTSNIGTTGGLALDSSLTTIDTDIKATQPRDVTDRVGRLLGIIYGSQGQQLKQTATNFNTQVEIAVGGTLIDPRQIRALTSSDVVTANAGTGTFTVGGTVTANAGTGNFTVVQSTAANLNATVIGTVTANIGTTNGLALDATLAKLTVAQSTSLGSNTQALVGGSVTTAAPTYITGNINPLSLTTSGALRIDGSGSTQPISGTVTANQGTSPWVENISQFGGSNVVTGTGASGAGIPRVTVSNDSNILATQSGSWTVTANAGTGNFTVVQATASNLNANVSGTVTANIGTTNGLALDTSVNGILVSQGSTTSGEKGPIVQGAVTTNAPTYVTAQTSPLSLTTGGLLRVDASATDLTVEFDQDSSITSFTAFSRLRTANPETIFDCKLLTDAAPLFFDDQQTSGSGTTSTYQTNQAMQKMSVALNTAGTRVRQTFRRFNYQPGKLLADYENILTTTGWKKVNEITTADVLFDMYGKPSKILDVVHQDNRSIYRFTFDDGTTVDADEEHLWVTVVRQNIHKGEHEILTTKQMLERYGSHPPTFARWRIPSSPVLDIPEKSIPLSGYTIGALLGDGSLTNSTPQFTTSDPEMLRWIDGDIKACKSKYHYSICGISDTITQLNMHHRSENKFVPKDYLWNQASVRLAVLQGLMDTDGTVDVNDGTAEFNTASTQLAKDVEFLVRSLGGQIKQRQRTAGYKKADGSFKKCLDTYRIRIIMPVCPFRLTRKANKWKPRTRISFDRYVHSIEYIGQGSGSCFFTENESNTFLTNGHVVTHNSHLILCTGVLGAGTSGVTRRIGYFDQNNGLFFQLSGATMSVVSRSFTSGSAVDTVANQSSWNIDKLDGTGPSGITIDTSKTQIFIIDFQWLGVGRVRFGFDINGVIRYCHQFLNANVSTLVYMSTPNLPLRYEISSTGTNAAADLMHICTTVISEGGIEDTGYVISADRGVTPMTTASTTNLYPVVSIRLKSTSLGATVSLSQSTVVCATNAAYRYAIILNPTVAGTALNFVGITNSAVEADVTSTNATTITGGTLIVSGYGQSGGSTGNTQLLLPTTLTIGSSIAGVADILVLAVARVTGTSEDFFGSLTWREEI